MFSMPPEPERATTTNLGQLTIRTRPRRMCLIDANRTLTFPASDAVPTHSEGPYPVAPVPVPQGKLIRGCFDQPLTGTKRRRNMTIESRTMITTVVTTCGSWCIA
jgi:hypothetical protein